MVGCVISWGWREVCMFIFKLCVEASFLQYLKHGFVGGAWLRR